MRLGYWVLDKDHNLVEADGVLEWGRFFENIDNRRVNFTRRNHIEISTVFLGIDHNFDHGAPLLFETMVFGSGRWGGYQERYHTWQEAEEGHQTTVKMVFRGWQGFYTIVEAELLHLWQVTLALKSQETWKDTLRWILGRKK